MIPFKLKRNTIQKSIQKIGLVCISLIVSLGYFGINGTNSFFSDSSTISGFSFSAGIWIPELSISIDPENPDGKDGWYKSNPCVSLSSTLDSTIFYSLGEEYIQYDKECIEIEDGEWNFSAYSHNNDNLNWKSSVIEKVFKVGPKDISEKGDVIINELMWMGSDDDSKDEWIELRNMTDREIDISNWNIENGGKGKGHIEIPNGYSIKSKGFFLILKSKWKETAINISEDFAKNEGMTNVSSMNLLNNGEKLTLKNKQGDTIDIAWKNDKWPEGESGIKKKSMERNDDPGDGTDEKDWHTCEDDRCNDEKYWKADNGNNFGTPGMKNSTKVEISSELNDATENVVNTENDANNKEGEIKSEEISKTNIKKEPLPLPENDSQEIVSEDTPLKNDESEIKIDAKQEDSSVDESLFQNTLDSPDSGA